GATSRDISTAFLTLGAALALGGLAVGGASGVGLALLLDHFGLISPPGEIYYIDHVPFRLLGRDLLAVVGATLVFTLACTVYGARRAAALQPIEALKGT
ncbi:MAG: lipoprotein-releasing system transmembrane subunit LolC, partial [Acidobacteriota bacterium]